MSLCASKRSTRCRALAVAGASGLHAVACAQCRSWLYVGHALGPGYHTPSAFDSWRGYIVFPNATIESPATFDTRAWNGQEWTLLTLAGPDSRSDFPAAFDSERGVIVIHGGNSGDPAEDTWEFDGVKWKEVNYGGVAPRVGHTLVYHPAQDRTFLFGGKLTDNDGSTFYDEMWAWNSHTKSWGFQSVTPRPSKRTWHSMAFDSWRGVSVLFGGRYQPPGGASITLGDTWEWTGGDWVERLPSVSPPPTYRAAMIFDSRRGVVVLWGGLAGR